MHLGGFFSVLLFFDDIYPSQLTGPDKDGDEITLNVCPPALNEDAFSLENVVFSFLLIF